MSLPEALFARYFSVGLQGALMAALVICLRAAAKRRAPRRLWPALWCVAALRLLVPVRFTGAWALWPSHAGAGLGGGQAGKAHPAQGAGLRRGIFGIGDQHGGLLLIFDAWGTR